MDVFVEKIVEKKKSVKDIAITFALWIVALVLSVLAIALLSSLGIFIVVGIIYGVWYLTSSMNLEFEYILTNDDIDIDTIIAKRKRKRLITLHIKEFEAFGPYIPKNQNEYNSDSIKKKIYAVSSLDSQDAYYAVFGDKDFGKTLLVFEPDRRMLDKIKTFNPRKVF